MAIVPLILQARDEATAVVNRVSKALGVLTNAAAKTKVGQGLGAASQQAKSLTDQITAGVLKANLLQQGMGAIVGTIQSGVGAMQSGIAKSAELQLSNLSTASGFAAQTGLAFKDAQGFIDDLNNTLSVSSASLPGTTAGYTELARSLTDNLVPAFKGANGAVDLAALKKAQVNFAESYGTLAAGEGKNPLEAGMGVSRALGGSSISGLRELAFFQNSPLLAEYETQLKARGATSFADVDLKTRIKILEDAGKKYVSDEFKSAATNSVSGLMEGFRSALFDPSSGVFGFSRDLDLKTEGIQSAFSAFNDVVKEIIGSDGIFFQVGKVFTSLGINFPEPMAQLKAGLDFALVGLKKINVFLKGVEQFGKADGSIDRAIKLLPTWLSSGLNLTDIPQRLGVTLAAGVNTLADGLVAIVGTVFANSDTIVATIGKALGFVVETFVSFLSNLDPSTHFVLAAAALGAAIVPVLFTGVTAAFIAVIGVIGAAIGGIPVLVVGAIVLATLGVVALARSGWEPVKAAIGGMFTTIGDFFTSAMGWIEQQKSSVLAAIKPIADALVRLLEDAYDAVAVALGKKTIGQQRAEATVAAGQTRYGGTLAAHTNAAGQIFVPDAMPAKNAASQPVATLNAVPKWMGNTPKWMSGFVPNAAGGLFAAAEEESKRMPPGAQLAVSNTSELIIPAKNIKSTRPQSGGGSRTVNLGGVTLNLYGISDPKTIADKVIQEIQLRFESELQGVLG